MSKNNLRDALVQWYFKNAVKRVCTTGRGEGKLNWPPCTGSSPGDQPGQIKSMGVNGGRSGGMGEFWRKAFWEVGGERDSNQAFVLDPSPVLWQPMAILGGLDLQCCLRWRSSE